MQKDIATIRFNDAVTNEDCVAIVRVLDDEIGLALSQQSNGDVETFLSLETARQLLLALQNAIAKVAQ